MVSNSIIQIADNTCLFQDLINIQILQYHHAGRVPHFLHGTGRVNMIHSFPTPTVNTWMLGNSHKYSLSILQGCRRKNWPPENAGSSKPIKNMQMHTTQLIQIMQIQVVQPTLLMQMQGTLEYWAMKTIILYMHGYVFMLMPNHIQCGFCYIVNFLLYLVLNHKGFDTYCILDPSIL